MLMISSYRLQILFQRYYSKKTKSTKWIQRQMRDPYVKKAHEEDWRCRSAYKLLEINEKHKILKPGQIVIDCGCAPGSWTQVVVDKINANGRDGKQTVGYAIGIDLQQVAPIEGAELLCGCDFTSATTQSKILSILNGRKVDVVLSDMAPTRSNEKSFDHFLIAGLCSSVIKFSTLVMKNGGILLCKIMGGDKQDLVEDGLKKLFTSVRTVKPPASRPESAEIYLLAKDFRGLINQK